MPSAEAFVTAASEAENQVRKCVERSGGAELESEKSEPQPVPGTPGVAGFPIPNPPYLRKRCCYWAAA